jgi:hypothetical protein
MLQSRAPLQMDFASLTVCASQPPSKAGCVRGVGGVSSACGVDSATLGSAANNHL